MDGQLDYQAVLVLGCGINTDGSLGDDPRSSVEAAADLYRHQARPVIFSGGHSYKAELRPSLSESQAMQHYALQQGILAEDIVVEGKSFNTVSNFYFCKTEVLEPRGWRQIIVIPGPNHLKQRVEHIASKILGPSYQVKIIDRFAGRMGEAERETQSLHKFTDIFENVTDGDDAAVLAILKREYPDIMNRL